jgi:NTP pyrophosphatase (non-canonical NTP hydrolase)
VSHTIDLQEVQAFLQRFAEERDWVQFHTPKNLAMALAAEAGELLEIFQWMRPEQSVTLKGPVEAAVGEELADILQYLVRLADVLDIDLKAALWQKLRMNEARFPRD